ncbi:NlpC/P60 family protein [Clostridium sp.]|uniref:C40 family peptidase n=1 Tax=Clostridium sp. TaxID=1506 RepID=UPI002639BFD2|nr:NlpC/P60 family protein [Clostridium sp.]
MIKGINKNKNKKLISILIIIIVILGISGVLININQKDKYENEGINMTEEDRIIINEIIEITEEKLGFEYVWGGKGEIMTEERLDELIGYYGESYYPLKRETYIGNQAFDCSGLTYWAYKEITEVEIGYSTYDQEEMLKEYEVNKEDIQPGDLIFTPGHVVLYKGKGEIINAYSKLAYPLGGIKNGKLYLGKDSVIYRPIDYINNFINYND